MLARVLNAHFCNNKNNLSDIAKQRFIIHIAISVEGESLCSTVSQGNTLLQYCGFLVTAPRLTQAEQNGL